MWVAPQMITPIVGALAAVGMMMGWRRIAQYGIAFKARTWIYCGVSIGVLALYKGFFSIDAILSFKTLGKIAALCLMTLGVHALYACASAPQKRLWLRVFMINFGIACLVYTTITLSHNTFLTLKGCIQGGLFTSVMFWATLLITLHNHSILPRFISALIVVSALFAIIVTPCDTTFLGIALGGGVLILFYAIRHVCVEYFMHGVILLSFLAAPFIALKFFEPEQIPAYTFLKDNSHIHRLYVWHNTSQVIMQRPLLGHGLGTSKSFSCKDTHDDACYFLMPYTKRNGAHVHIRAEKMGVHPHNLALQLWLDLGALGACIGAFATAYIWRCIYRMRNHVERACYMGLFTTAMLAFWVNLGMFQTWWWCVILWCVSMMRTVRKEL